MRASDPATQPPSHAPGASSISATAGRPVAAPRGAGRWRKRAQTSNPRAQDADSHSMSEITRLLENNARRFHADKEIRAARLDTVSREQPPASPRLTRPKPTIVHSPTRNELSSRYRKKLDIPELSRYRSPNVGVVGAENPDPAREGRLRALRRGGNGSRFGVQQLQERTPKLQPDAPGHLQKPTHNERAASVRSGDLLRQQARHSRITRTSTDWRTTSHSEELSVARSRNTSRSKAESPELFDEQAIVDLMEGEPLPARPLRQTRSDWTVSAVSPALIAATPQHNRNQTASSGNAASATPSRKIFSTSQKTSNLPHDDVPANILAVPRKSTKMKLDTQSTRLQDVEPQSSIPPKSPLSPGLVGVQSAAPQQYHQSECISSSPEVSTGSALWSLSTPSSRVSRLHTPTPRQEPSQNVGAATTVQTKAVDESTGHSIIATEDSVTNSRPLQPRRTLSAMPSRAEQLPRRAVPAARRISTGKINKRMRHADGVHEAAANGHFGMLILLLDMGYQIDSVLQNGRTALHEACDKGNAQIVAALVQRGASKDIKDNAGQTALDVATASGNNACIKALQDGRIPFKTRTDNRQNVFEPQPSFEQHSSTVPLTSTPVLGYASLRRSLSVQSTEPAIREFAATSTRTRTHKFANGLIPAVGDHPNDRDSDLSVSPSSDIMRLVPRSTTSVDIHNYWEATKRSEIGNIAHKPKCSSLEPSSSKEPTTAIFEEFGISPPSALKRSQSQTTPQVQLSKTASPILPPTSDNSEHRNRNVQHHNTPPKSTAVPLSAPVNTKKLQSEFSFPWDARVSLRIQKSPQSLTETDSTVSSARSTSKQLSSSLTAPASSETRPNEDMILSETQSGGSESVTLHTDRGGRKHHNDNIGGLSQRLQEIQHASILSPQVESIGPSQSAEGKLSPESIDYKCEPEPEHKLVPSLEAEVPGGRNSQHSTDSEDNLHSEVKSEFEIISGIHLEIDSQSDASVFSSQDQLQSPLAGLLTELLHLYKVKHVADAMAQAWEDGSLFYRGIASANPRTSNPTADSVLTTDVLSQLIPLVAAQLQHFKSAVATIEGCIRNTDDSTIVLSDSLDLSQTDSARETELLTMALFAHRLRVSKVLAGLGQERLRLQQQADSFTKIAQHHLCILAKVDQLEVISQSSATSEANQNEYVVALETYCECFDIGAKKKIHQCPGSPDSNQSLPSELEEALQGLASSYLQESTELKQVLTTFAHQPATSGSSVMHNCEELKSARSLLKSVLGYCTDVIVTGRPVLDATVKTAQASAARINGILRLIKQQEQVFAALPTLESEARCTLEILRRSNEDSSKPVVNGAGKAKQRWALIRRQTLGSMQGLAEVVSKHIHQQEDILKKLSAQCESMPSNMQDALEC